MFTPSPRVPSSPTGAAVDDGNLAQRSECIPKKRGSSPMLAIQWEISRVHGRVSRPGSYWRLRYNFRSPLAYETHPSSRG